MVGKVCSCRHQHPGAHCIIFESCVWRRRHIIFSGHVTIDHGMDGWVQVTDSPSSTGWKLLKPLLRTGLELSSWALCFLTAGIHMEAVGLSCLGLFWLVSAYFLSQNTIYSSSLTLLMRSAEQAHRFLQPADRDLWSNRSQEIEQVWCSPFPVLDYGDGKTKIWSLDKLSI